MIEYVLFAIGLFFLVKGADLLVKGSSSLANRWKISGLIIGLSVVSFGTSMPELFVNVFEAINGAGEVALGNIIGSNLSNILLVLGLTALIYPLKLRESTVWKEIPFSILAAGVLLLLAFDFFINKTGEYVLSRLDGLILLLLFGFFIFYLFKSMRKSKNEVRAFDEVSENVSYGSILFMILLGVVGLYFGGKWVVEGAVLIASIFGMSEFVISATVIAIGTSLPELVTSIVAAIKKSSDIAVGNIVGSNIFNIFWILGVTAVISPISVPEFINLDIMFLIFVSILLFLMIVVKKPFDLNRYEGSFLFLLYVGYILFLIVRG